MRWLCHAAPPGRPWHSSRRRGSEALPLTLENIFRGGRGGAGESDDFAGRQMGDLHRRARRVATGCIDCRPPARGEPELWAEAGGIEWAPDSQSVVFVRGERLWRLGLNEKQATALTPAVKGMRGPVFSPDGRTIAFSATASGHQDVWLVPAGGGEPRQLTKQAMPGTTAGSIRRGRPTGARLRSSRTRRTTGPTISG